MHEQMSITVTAMPASVAAVFLCLLSVAAAAAMDPAERETLFLVMDAVSSDRDWRSESPDPCSAPWPGLECKPATALPGNGNGNAAVAPLHVTRLDFGVEPNPSCKDTATFPPEVLTLPHLQSLFFVDCFKNPAATTALVLPSSANLSSSGLQQLSIRANPSLTGVMPPQLAGLRSLQVLTISQNGLIRGEIPRGIGELRSLVHLDLSYNSLTGPVPPQITDLRGLVGLDLSYNSLSGPIPGRIGDLRQLQKLDLSSNNLTGGSLTTLSLENNNLTGVIPAGLSRLHRMYHLNLSNNGLGGTVPFDGAFLRRLGRNLDLSGNAGLCLDDRDVVRDVGIGVGACRGGGDGDGSLARDSVSSATTGGVMRGSTDGFRFRLLGPVCVVFISCICFFI